MAVTWKQLAYSTDVSVADSKAVSAASMATSEGVVRSTADSSLVALIGTPATSVNLSSEVVTRSTADSSLTLTVSTADSKAVIADSKAVSAASVANSQNTVQASSISTADSKAVSAASMATSEGLVRSTADSTLTLSASTADSKAVVADSKAVSAASMATSEGVVRSTADSSLTAKLLNNWGNPNGAVAFAGQQATDMVFHTVATSAAITGVTPVPGKIVWATDSLSLWVNTVAV